MFKVHPLVLAAALFGAKPATMAVSAAGCFALYSSGKDYKEGDVVSVDITETKSETVTCSPGSSGCSASGTKVVSKDIKVRVNYRCISTDFCGNVGYAPDGLHSGLAWMKMGSECTDNGTPATVAPPAEWSEGGCPAEYKLGTIYAPNAFVSVATNNGYSLVYQCTSDSASSAWCGMEGYQPGDSLYFEEVWTVQGSCDGTLSPTSSPIFVTLPDMGGCSEEWERRDSSNPYKEGDKVASNGIVYACKGWPFSTHCGQDGYEPNSNPATPGAWEDAWTVVGYCSGSMGPTGSPTFDELKPFIEGCPEDYSPSKTDYNAGEQVSYTVSTTPERKIVYECKSWPSVAWCGQAAYAPGGEYSDMAWTLKGACEGTISPTPAPQPYLNFESQAGEGDWPCQYEKCREEEIEEPCTYSPNYQTGCPASGCTSCSTDSTTGIKTCTDCTKQVMGEVCRAAPVENWGAIPITEYSAGDVVRIGAIRFKAKDYPGFLWARQEAFQPYLEENGIWTQAWERDGICPHATSVSAQVVFVTTVTITQTLTLSGFELPEEADQRAAVISLLEDTIKRIVEEGLSGNGEVTDVTIISIDGEAINTNGRLLQVSTAGTVSLTYTFDLKVEVKSSGIIDFSFSIPSIASEVTNTFTETLQETLQDKPAATKDLIGGAVDGIGVESVSTGNVTTTTTSVSPTKSPSTSPTTSPTRPCPNKYFTSTTALKNAVTAYVDTSRDCTSANPTNCPIGQTYGHPIGSWCVGDLTNMFEVFLNKYTFNEDISNWDVSRVTTMERMFVNAQAFNSDISLWDVSQVTTMKSMFSSARAFNGNIGEWNVSSVTDMDFMFASAWAFNSDISLWDVSQVTTTESMFSAAYAFNSTIGAWNVSNVINMDGMFKFARAFNADISAWDVSNMRYFREMFRGRSSTDKNSFNQNLCAWGDNHAWHISQIFVSDMFLYTNCPNTGTPYPDSNWCYTCP